MALGNSNKTPGDVWGKIEGFSEGSTALPHFKKGCRNVKPSGGVSKVTSV